MRLQGRRALVTGASGFVGGRLVEKLLIEEGAAVNCLTRDWSKAVWVSRTAADLLEGDVTDADAVGAAIQGCDLVIHCASGGTTRDQLNATNVAGTKCLLDAAVRLGVRRFVYVSSIAVLGASPPTGDIGEAAYDDGGRAYPASKIAAEKLVLDYAHRGALSATIIRPTFVWGPRSHLFTAGPLGMMRNRTFRWVDHGRGSCHAVYVDNLVESLILAAIRDGVEGKAFLVTDESGMTWRDFFGALLELAPEYPVGSVSSRSTLVRALCRLRETASGGVVSLAGSGKPVHVRAIRRFLRETELLTQRMGMPTYWDLLKFARSGPLDTSATRDILGYRPIKTFQDAMQETVQWVRMCMVQEQSTP